MKAKSIWMGAALLALSLFLIAPTKASAMGADYATNDVHDGSSSAWPKGMAGLVRSTNWVHGYWVNSEDLSFFAGSAANFSAFLDAYSQVQGVEKHVLVLHDGAGEARSPWQKQGKPCDWKLYGCPKSWLNIGDMTGTNSVEALRAAAADTNYVLEVHFWTGGKIDLKQIAVPVNVEITKVK